MSCYKCNYRAENCHSKCLDYAKYKERLEDIKKARSEDLDYHAYVKSNIKILARRYQSRRG